MYQPYVRKLWKTNNNALLCPFSLFQQFRQIPSITPIVSPRTDAFENNGQVEDITPSEQNNMARNQAYVKNENQQN